MCRTIALCTNAKRTECGCRQHERGGCGGRRVRASAARGGRRAHRWYANELTRMLAAVLLRCCLADLLCACVRCRKVDVWEWQWIFLNALREPHVPRLCCVWPPPQRLHRGCKRQATSCYQWAYQSLTALIDTLQPTDTAGQMWTLCGLCFPRARLTS
jgi:hypothetical protein